MSANPIDKLERQLQDLIEGAFTRLFRRRINARDIALLLLRALEDQAYLAQAIGTRPVAPDSYAIYLHPDKAARFLARYPDLPTRLARLLAELSKESGYRLYTAPSVSVLADSLLETHQARVTAEHSPAARAKTEKMASVSAGEPLCARAQNAHLHIDGIGAVPLAKSVINIGRESSNDVVIRDAFVSRHHVQLRKRFDVYILFDVDSRGGTLVNNTAVSEHRLQNGDVIRIGHTDLVYADDFWHGSSNGTTQVLPPD